MMDLNLQISLDVKGSKYDGNLKEIMKINEADLMNEFINQPSTYAWFAALSEISSAEVELKKFNLSVLEANLDKKKREELSVNDKKVTESMVKSAIQSDAKFIALNEELLELQRQYGILRAIVGSLHQRKDMLIQIGSMKRQEMMLDDFGVSLKKVRENK